jgi:hypothetical protein
VVASKLGDGFLFQKTHSKKNTVRSYHAIIERLIQEFGDDPIDQITPEHILTFLNRLIEGNKPYTKRIRYSQLSSFFNFVRNSIDPDSKNPCDWPMIRKLYREKVPARWEIIEKETVEGSAKSPISALHCISKSLRRNLSTPHSSRFTRRNLKLFSKPSGF